jgi:hypothetical protein
METENEKMITQNVFVWQETTQESPQPDTWDLHSNMLPGYIQMYVLQRPQTMFPSRLLKQTLTVITEKSI